jgi:MFS family permease
MHEELIMADAALTVRVVRDLNGLRYRVGEQPADLMGRSRTWMLWLPWLAMAAISVLQYGFGVAAGVLGAAAGWSPTSTFWVFALWLVFQAVAAAGTSVLRHRGTLRPSRAMACGALLCGVGPLALGLTHHIEVAVLGYSVLCGVGAGIVYATCTSVVAKWFPEARGRRVAFASGAFGYGAAPLIVIAGLVGASADWAAVAGITGACLAVIVAACGLLLRDPPREWWPGDIDPRLWAVDKRVNPGRRCHAAAVRQYAPAQAIRTSSFVVMYSIMVVAAAGFLLALAYLPTIAGDYGFGSLVAVSAVSLLAVVSGAGRAAAYRISDRLGRRRTLSGALLLAGVAHLGLVLSAVTGQAVPFVLLAALTGLAGGAFYPLLAGLAADYFGEQNAVRNFGVVYSAKAIGGLIGVGLPAFTVATPRLTVAFVAAGVICVLAALATRWLRRPGYVLVRVPH